MRSLFKGGSMDGVWCDTPGASRHIVPKPLPQVASVDDFRIINLDHVWNGRPPPPCEKQVYRCSVVKNDDGSFSHLLYTLEVP